MKINLTQQAKHYADKGGKQHKAMADLFQEVSDQLFVQTDVSAEAFRISKLAKNQKLKIRFLKFPSGFQYVDREENKISDAIQKSDFRNKIDFQAKVVLDVGNIQDTFLNNTHLGHFAGFVNESGYIVVGNNNDQFISTSALIKFFELFARKKKIVGLCFNAFFDQQVAAEIAQRINIVIGIGNTVSHETKIEFARTFYAALGADCGLAFAFDLARNSIDLNNLDGKEFPYIFENGILKS